MYKIAAIGDRQSVSGFASLGLETFEPVTHDDGAKLINQLANGDYAVIYITEKTAALLPEVIEKYRFKSKPAIILIPGVNGNTGEGLKSVHRSVEKAVGSDILSK